MTTEAGWRPDPYARARQRYWDGTAFTDRIRNDDGTGEGGGEGAGDAAGDATEFRDPLGATATIPFTNPTGISPTPRVAEVHPQGFFGSLITKVTTTVKRLFKNS